MRGRSAAERLLAEAQELLVGQGSPAVEVGFLHLRAVLACPEPPQVPLPDVEGERAALRRLEAVLAP